MPPNPKQLRIIPLGGLGEIGKNMTVFELGDDAFILDTGVMFPSNDMFGIDLIIPDFRYLLQRKNLKIHGILYTHGHEDHIGAAGYVVDALRGVPLYATPLTAVLLEVKLRDAHVLNTTTINVFKPGDSLKIGPFKIDSYHTTHSIPDCVGFGIHTPFGMVVHSGDYKFDNTPIDGKKPDFAKIAEFSSRGVVLLMGDSTNAEKPGWTPSESIVNGAFDTIFRQSKARIIVATFASHISRIQQIADLAVKYNRKLAIAGHSMTENVKRARQMGLLNIHDNYLVDLTKINGIQPQNLVIMATGSQGEPSAVLSRLATGQHRSLDVMPGDTIVVSAHTIPGNEEGVSRTINKLFQRGAEVIYDPLMPVHVSGHASQEEMKLLINLLNPKYFLPVHGELRHLRAHARLGIAAGIPKENIFVVENGHVIEVDKGGVRVGERIPGGYVFVDANGVGDMGKTVMRERETLARDGFLTIVASVDGTGRMVGEPEIISRGFVYMRDANALVENIRQTVTEALLSARGVRGIKRRERVQEALGKMLYAETKRRPMVFCIIQEAGSNGDHRQRIPVKEEAEE